MCKLNYCLYINSYIEEWVRLTVLPFWFCHHAFNMTDEMNQRQQTVTFPFEISHRTQTQVHYCLRKNVSVLITLIWMTSDLDTHNENAHPKLQTRAQRTNTTHNSLLHVWAHSVTDYAELLFWKHEGDMVTIIVVSRKYFPGEEERKKGESPPIKDTMKLHALRKHNTFSLH